MPQVPLDVEFPGLPALTDASVASSGVQQTTLPNGLRVVSVDSASPISSVGAFVDAGSRYETMGQSGISHFLEAIAFKSTANRSDFKLVRDMNKIGAKVLCSTSREHTVYAAESLREHMPQTVETLADVIQNHAFNELELKHARESYAKGIEARAASAETQIMEGIHAAAYFNNSVGLPLYASKAALSSFTPDALRDYMTTLFTPSRMVISGVGVDHADFVQQVGASFQSLPANNNLQTAPAQYTGGEVRMHNTSGDIPFAHVALGFETTSWQSKDVVKMCVLSIMMGGGGAFSAGGPGKGMYSRLYERVLNRYGWIEMTNSFNSLFNDTAIFGIYGMSDPQYVGNLTEVLVDQLKGMSGAIDAEELSRAKNQLKSAVHMQLEQQNLLMEDLGRQLLTYNKVRSPADICAEIDACTEADIRRVAAEMVKTPVSVSAYGNLSYLPRYDSIAAEFAK
jgi:processing peptidase subunit alpha